MTTDHEEAVRLAEKHQADRGDIIHYTGPLYRFTPAGLAALIAEVRRKAMEEAAETEIYIDPSDMTNQHRRWYSEGVESLRGAIRAELVPLKGKEEGDE
jgi:hypothetical protein